MKFILPIFSLLLTSCAIHSGSFHSNSFQKENIPSIELASGSASAQYILGIGGLDASHLMRKAKAQMMKYHPLEGDQFYDNFVTDIQRTFYLIYWRIDITITADILDPTPEKVGLKIWQGNSRIWYNINTNRLDTANVLINGKIPVIEETQEPLSVHKNDFFLSTPYLGVSPGDTVKMNNRPGTWRFIGQNEDYVLFDLVKVDVLLIGQRILGNRYMIVKKRRISGLEVLE